MNGVRALLAILWLALSLAATAHAGAAAQPPCHMNVLANMPGMAHHQTRHDDQAFMPCCSQPVVIALPAPVMLSERRVERVHFRPTTAVALIDRPRPIEPRPPKAA